MDLRTLTDDELTAERERLRDEINALERTASEVRKEQHRRMQERLADVSRQIGDIKTEMSP